MENLSREDSGEPSDSEQKNFYISVSVDVEADPRARYYLKSDRNYFYDDDLNLKINAKHLLSTGMRRWKIKRRRSFRPRRR